MRGAGAEEGACVRPVRGGLPNKTAALHPGCDIACRSCVWAMSFIRREGERTLSSQIFGEPEEVWLTADKPHCHLALTTIRPGVLAGQIPVSSPRWDRPTGTDAYIWYPKGGGGVVGPSSQGRWCFLLNWRHCLPFVAL